MHSSAAVQHKFELCEFSSARLGTWQRYKHIHDTKRCHQVVQCVIIGVSKEVIYSHYKLTHVIHLFTCA